MDEVNNSYCQVFLSDVLVKEEPGDSSHDEEVFRRKKSKKSRKEHDKRDTPILDMKKMTYSNKIKKLKQINRVKSKKIDVLEKIASDYKQKVTNLRSIVKRTEYNQDSVPKLNAVVNKFGSKEGIILMQGIEYNARHKQRYSQELKSFAISLHLISPKAYNYMREVFHPCLPSARTLRKWSENFDVLGETNGNDSGESHEDDLSN